MKNRRGFLTALSVVSGAALGLAAAGRSESAPSSPPPAALPVPKPAKAPSAAALAVAASYRAFDPALSDDEVRGIARMIDDNRVGAQLNPKKKPLRNWDEMALRFAPAPDERG